MLLILASQQSAKEQAIKVEGLKKIRLNPKKNFDQFTYILSNRSSDGQGFIRGLGCLCIEDFRSLSCIEI